MEKELMRELLDRYEQYESMKMDNGAKKILGLYIKKLEARLIKALQDK